MKNILIGLLLIILTGAMIGGIVYNKSLAKQNNLDEPFATNKKCPYKNINQLRCEPELAKKKKEYVVLKSDLVDYIETEKKDGSITSASVYFRDLQNGPIMSINEQELFAPASLLKVPLMITYFKKAEEDPSVLKRKLTVAGNIQSLPQNITAEKSAEKGKTYTIDELIALLITQSDNTSWKMLLNDLRKEYSENYFVMILSDLGIIDPRKSDDMQYITVQSYASIFRILYNSSYLNLAMSDKALGLLSQSVFNDGIVAGIPEGIKVAHKFGERKEGTEQQLHDCGIVYYPQNPYLICIMTKGQDILTQEKIIQQISKDIYQEIEERN